MSSGLRRPAVSASSDTVVGNAPVADAGVAGGLRATSLQVGGALGTSVLMSLISGRVGSSLGPSLVSAGVPERTTHQLQGAEDAAAMGVAPVSAAMPERLREAVVEGSDHAFVTGPHTAALTTGVLCAAGALTAVLGLRGRREG